MDQLRSYADDRLVHGCVYCGGPEETRDHVPSRVFLDMPLPENLPVVWACRRCNSGFSKDEEYVACLVESAIAGSTDPDRIRRPRIANILRHASALRARIEAAKRSAAGATQFDVEADRVVNVMLKLARGHAAFDLSTVCLDKPSSFWCMPLVCLTEEQRQPFDSIHIVNMMCEVGSRSSQRMFALELTLQSPSGQLMPGHLLALDWVDVQDGCYRYLAVHDAGGVIVRMVIAEYLACEVIWTA